MATAPLPLSPSRRATSSSGLEFIERHESFSPVIYLCEAGKRTIGYGHVVKPLDTLRGYPIPLTEAAARDILSHDVAPIELYLSGVFPDIPQRQFDALVSLIFNIGLGNFEDSTLFKKLKAGDVAGAANEFGRWIYVTKNGKKVASAGLRKRRSAERAVFLGEAV